MSKEQISKGRNIFVTEELEAKIVESCEVGIEYFLNDGYVDLHELEIKTSIELLRLFGRDEEADDFEGQFKEWMEEYRSDD